MLTYIDDVALDLDEIACIIKDWSPQVRGVPPGEQSYRVHVILKSGVSVYFNSDKEQELHDCVKTIS